MMKDMSRFLCLLALGIVPATAEVRSMTLREAVAKAVAGNPDVTISRLNEQIATENVRITKGPLTPRVIFGSGLAYSNGFPMSIEGSAPSIIQGRAIQAIYNRPLSFRVAAARESARGADIETVDKREEVAFRTASLYLDAERLNRQTDLAQKQVESLGKVADVVQSRVQEGRELEIENKRAAFNLAVARQRVASLERQKDLVEADLAVAVGMSPDDRVRPTPDDRAGIAIPASTQQSLVEQALASNKGLRKLEADLRVKALEVQAAKAERYPQLDLVAQYGLFAKFNNYEDFFRRFQRHNGQLGVSITLPIMPGSGSQAQAAQATFEMQRMRTEFAATRDRVTIDTRKRFQEVEEARNQREVARLDLDLTREQLNVLLAQFEEGRATLRMVEEARAAESTKWMAFYDAQMTVERARLSLLRETGQILAALR